MVSTASFIRPLRVKDNQCACSDQWFYRLHAQHHLHRGLCCKSGKSFETFYRAMEKKENYRWGISGISYAIWWWYASVTKFVHLVCSIMSCNGLHNRVSSCRWFCHFDDDVYVNLQELVKLLKRYKPEWQNVYIGHHPRWLHGPLKVCCAIAVSIFLAVSSSYQIILWE